MNLYQEKLIANTKDLPDELVEEIVDFSEFIKKKYKSQSFKKRMKSSERDIAEGRVKQVTPSELFKELGI